MMGGSPAEGSAELKKGPRVLFQTLFKRPFSETVNFSKRFRSFLALRPVRMNTELK